jgi:hypothetical protein
MTNKMISKRKFALARNALDRRSFVSAATATAATLALPSMIRPARAEKN